jgi:hypothetical protein
MCNFASFAVNKITANEPLKIYVGDYMSHSGIESGHVLTPGAYRECEWTDDGPESLVVRVENGEDVSVYRAAILAAYPTRSALFADNREGKIGSPKSIINFNVAGQRDGLYESWYDSGQMSERTTYKAGQRDGLYESWYDSGQMSERTTYKAGQRDGLYESWYDNGQPSFRTTFEAGVRYESQNDR